MGNKTGRSNRRGAALFRRMLRMCLALSPGFTTMCCLTSLKGALNSIHVMLSYCKLLFQPLLERHMRGSSIGSFVVLPEIVGSHWQGRFKTLHNVWSPTSLVVATWITMCWVWLRRNIDHAEQHQSQARGKDLRDVWGSCYEHTVREACSRFRSRSEVIMVDVGGLHYISSPSQLIQQFNPRMRSAGTQ